MGAHKKLPKRLKTNKFRGHCFQKKTTAGAHNKLIQSLKCVLIEALRPP